ncbi:MAG: hypothetical protein JWR61_2949 [Ferruginibacter sp.]|uniref:hypothetical protein n=1 Tax=Ferruginibacter sp. TaxID=1940288 RepID=UPI002658203A|nr:hypothetical protein [Ferruginibacter sp.]MDB5277994.1 hypothetical protein [Ferruginibacter sp.]
MSEEKQIDEQNQEQVPAIGQDKILPVEETEILEIKNTETKQEMEVHHHTHAAQGKKNWKTYTWEFLMLFLAVFCGFLAEYQLEHVIEHQREKEYANALYTELSDDSTVAANKLSNRLDKEKDMDYLSNYFRDSSLTDLPKAFYPAYTTSLYLINTYTFEPKDGILNQLKNSGSLRYFKSIALQKLLGDISVNINNMRQRNDQEYQYFASPIKPFMLKYYDWSWLDELRKADTAANVLDVINHYRQNNRDIKRNILNIPSLDRAEAANLVLFYKQMLVSTRSLQLNNYIVTNHSILQVLRENYSLENE